MVALKRLPEKHYTLIKLAA